MRSALRHAEEQVRRLGLRQPPRIDITVPDAELASSDLALTISDVASYAMTGAGDPADLNDQLTDILAAVTSTPDEPGRPLEALGEQGDFQSELLLVLVAAIGRRDIATGKVIHPGVLSALAGLSTRQMWHLIKQGEVQDTDAGVVEPAEARRFLAGRGVPGFDAKRKS